MKKKDLVLIGFLLIIAIVGMIAINLGKKPGSQVVITVDGNIYKTADIKEDQTILVNTKNGDNTVVIADGMVDMTKADCPDKICVNHKKISKSGETIVCLPQKVVVEVTGMDDKELDGISG